MPDMTLTDLLARVARGEDSTTQFKVDVRNAESLASEMAAFANAEGGSIFIGVADQGATPGLSREDVSRINQLVSNAASQLVRSPLAVQTQNIQLQSGRIVIVLTMPKGIDKPYFDKNGVIWLKCGADKRRINSKEELRRFFQFSDQFHADELPTKADITKIDKLRFRDFLRKAYNLDYPDSRAELLRLLQNMDLAAADGNLNLAGVLLFAERPEWIKPQFMIKAVRYSGNEIHSTEYLDTEDFSGPLRNIFDGALSFVMRNLPKVQAGNGVNSPGTPEIPPSVFEELLVNALIHRDYLVSATIRLFIFDNRIEIISPGSLPNNLTVERIRAGISNIRNPILVSYVAKGMLPYKGLGSGIKRALEDWPNITFTDDRDGCQFTATVHRKVVRKSVGSSLISSPMGSPKTPLKTPVKNEQAKKTPVETPVETGKSVETPVETPVETGRAGEPPVKIAGRLIVVLQKNPAMTLAEAAIATGKSLRAVERACAKLIKNNQIRHIGPRKGGHWEVLK
jgi:ATP-dependent DNA helicase RecG